MVRNKPIDFSLILRRSMVREDVSSNKSHTRAAGTFSFQRSRTNGSDGTSLCLLCLRNKIYLVQISVGSIRYAHPKRLFRRKGLPQVGFEPCARTDPFS